MYPCVMPHSMLVFTKVSTTVYTLAQTLRITQISGVALQWCAIIVKTSIINHEGVC
jgi:hypothetical protein